MAVSFFTYAHTSATVSVLCIFQDVFARVCVRECEKSGGGLGLMPCCQRSPHDEVVKAQGDGRIKEI